MGKQVAIFLVLYIAIITTLLNIYFFGNNKMMNNPKLKKLFKISLIAGVMLFSVVFMAYLSIKL